MSGWTLPENPFPNDVVCIQVKVPNDPAYIEAFFGQMLDLAAAFNWENDEAHTALLARDRMRQMYMELHENNCPIIPDKPGGGCGCDMCNQLRFNNCVLEQFDCFTQEWIPVPTVGSCVPETSPGKGVVPPVGGQCVEFTIQADSRALTPMPFVVNSGDTIQVTAIKGAGTDGSSTWYCADGSIFVLGACAGGGYTQPSDPLNTAKHMALLWKIGANYYPLNTSLFTVPPGVVNMPIFIQTNDPSLTNNSGSYGLEMNFCNNQGAPAINWCQVFDFTLSPFGFTGYAFPDGSSNVPPAASWAPGVGWKSNSQSFDGGASYDSLFLISIPVPSATYTYCEVHGFKGTDPANTQGLFVGVESVSNPPAFSNILLNLGGSAIAPSGNYVESNSPSPVAASGFIQVVSDGYGNPSPDTPNFTVTKLILKGTGVNPFGPSNC